MVIYIKDKNGRSLNPTVRTRMVRKLLEQHKAKVIKNKPFTIQLLYDVENKQPNSADMLKKRDV